MEGGWGLERANELLREVLPRMITDPPEIIESTAQAVGRFPPFRYCYRRSRATARLGATGPNRWASKTCPVADAPVLGASRRERFDGYHSPGGRCSRLGCEDRAGPPVGASTPTSPPAMVARIVVNDSGTGVPL